MKRAATVLILGLALLAGPFLWGYFHRDDPAPGQEGGLPWQVHVDAQGQVEALGLTLGRSTLQDVQDRWPDGLELAVVEAEAGHRKLEAFAPNVRAGFVTGKLVVSAQLAEAEVASLVEHAARREPTASGRFRWKLTEAQTRAVAGKPVAMLAFHPSARIDEDTLWARFGAPARKIAGPEGVIFGVYPERGLVLTRTSEGRVVIQYVPPAQVDELQRSLLTAGGADMATTASDAAASR